MAEFGAHITSLVGAKPSIFEVLAQENFGKGLRGAFRHLCKVLAEHFPEKFDQSLKYFEETYTLVDFVVQYVHLRLHGASFSENFYGLKRIPDPRSFSISKKHLLSSLVLLVVFPYFKLWLESLFKRLREKELDGSLNHYQNGKKVAAETYLNVYPVIHFLWEGTVLAYYVAYALGKSHYHSPLMHMTFTEITTLSSSEIIENQWEKECSEHYSLSYNVLWKLVKTFVSSLTVSLSVGAFFMQFLEFWYNRDDAVISLAQMPVPPPPIKWPMQIPCHICYLCSKPRSNDAALTSSGFVFCYPCIFKFIQEKNVCPVTGYPSSLNQIVRLYHPG